MYDRTFEKAWKEIEKAYNSGRICSERHLQAELFHILYCDQEFLKNYELRIEPCLYECSATIDKKILSGIIPDMLVITRQNQEIIAHVELKYVPHGFIPFEKDITNMVRLWNLRANSDVHFYLNTSPKSGDWDYELRYKVSQDFQLIYCLIGNEESHCITDPSNIWSNSLTGLTQTPIYKHLVGKIIRDREPEFYSI